MCVESKFAHGGAQTACAERMMHEPGQRRPEGVLVTDVRSPKRPTAGLRNRYIRAFTALSDPFAEPARNHTAANPPMSPVLMIARFSSAVPASKTAFESVGRVSVRRTTARTRPRSHQRFPSRRRRAGTLHR